jgi:predicted MFS family arabinose efflux permease
LFKRKNLLEKPSIDAELSAAHPDRAQTRTEPTTISQRLVLIMAFVCAVSAANLYYIQPLLAVMRHGFGVSAGQMGAIPTILQSGYALGLLLIVPLGDYYNQRSLILSMLILVALALAAMASAPTLFFLGLAGAFVGLTTVVPQLILPYAANLAPAPIRGRVLGTIMSGLLIGVLLARTVSGALAAWLGWRAMYWIAAVMMILLAVGLRFLLPPDRMPKGKMNYLQLLRSLWHLAHTQPALRETSLFGAMTFGAFSAFWVTLSFLLETPPYHFGSVVAGLFGLVGVAGALMASVVGKFSDRHDARYANGFTMLIALLAFIILWLFGYRLVGLIIGVILLDLGAQGNLVACQTRVYSLLEGARSRLNTVFMFSYFLGGSLGSLLGTLGWSIARWNGVCMAAILMLVAAFIVYFINSPEARRRVMQDS